MAPPSNQAERIAHRTDQHDGTDEPLRSKRPTLRHLVSLLVLAAAIHLILPRLGDLERSLRVVADMRFPLVALAVAAQLASYAGSGYMRKHIARLGAVRLSVRRGVLVELAVCTLGTMIGGTVSSAVASYRWASGSKRDAAAGVSVWLPSLLNNTVLLTLAFGSAAVLLTAGELSTVGVATIGATVALLGAGIGALVWAVSRKDHLLRAARAGARAWARIRHSTYDTAAVERGVDEMVDGMRLLLRGAWRRPALGALANVLFDFLTLALFFAATGEHVAARVLLAGYGLPLLISKMSVFGGAGVAEAAMAAAYHGFGIPDGVTIVVVLAYRLVSFWIPTLLGFPAIVYLNAHPPVEAAPR